MSYTTEEIALLERFQDTFKVSAHSMASQRVFISQHGTISYDDDNVYGETDTLDIIHEDEVVATIQQPNDDAAAILDFAKKWQALDYPNPEDETSLFDTQD